MKKMIFSSVLFLSSSAFAISDGALVKACWSRGVTKVVVQAQSYGCTFDADQVKVSGIDNRWYNTSKYIWFRVEAVCPNGLTEVQKLVQYYRGKCI